MAMKLDGVAESGAKYHAGVGHQHEPERQAFNACELGHAMGWRQCDL